MRTSLTHSYGSDDRYLLLDDSDEDASQIFTVICDGNPRTGRGFDFDAYAMLQPGSRIICPPHTSYGLAHTIDRAIADARRAEMEVRS